MRVIMERRPRNTFKDLVAVPGILEQILSHIPSDRDKANLGTALGKRYDEKVKSRMFDAMHKKATTLDAELKKALVTEKLLDDLKERIRQETLTFPGAGQPGPPWTDAQQRRIDVLINRLHTAFTARDLAESRRMRLAHDASMANAPLPRAKEALRSSRGRLLELTAPRTVTWADVDAAHDRMSERRAAIAGIAEATNAVWRQLYAGPNPPTDAERGEARRQARTLNLQKADLAKQLEADKAEVEQAEREVFRYARAMEREWERSS
eukprot:jgi/Mesvir1/16341/Mv18090-RA.1